MDGTRDRPPGKTAENWSRKDGIRAGAVTGPWRSAPRDPDALAARAPRPAVASARETVAASPPAAVAPPRAPARRSTPGLRVWIAIGALTAVALVAAAVIVRNTLSDEPGQSAAAPAAPASAVPAPKVGATTPGVPVEPALAGVTSIRLRVGPDCPPELRAAILAALTKAGLSAVTTEPLPFEIATSRVGYYRAEDLAAAEALGRVVAPVIADGGEVGVRDYGQLLSDPEPGRLDLWIGG